MARKKVVFVIVEGPSDDTALHVILSKIYDKNEVYIEIIHGDITTDISIDPDTIASKLGNLVKKYAKSRHFKREHFLKVIHLVDTDGAYIPDVAIIEDKNAVNPVYSLTNIFTNKPQNIIFRNAHKRSILNRIITLDKVWVSIPYQAYYMSCNLDHVLYDKLNSTDEEKEDDSYVFAKKYKNDIDGFFKFISESDFSIVDDYKSSWRFIKEGLHSLERYTNFGLCFKDTREEENIVSKKR